MRPNGWSQTNLNGWVPPPPSPGRIWRCYQKVSDPFTPLRSRHKNEAFMAGETGLLHPFPAQTTRTLIFFISSAPLPFPIGSIRKAEADLELPSSVLQPTASATRPTMTMNRSPASLGGSPAAKVPGETKTRADSTPSRKRSRSDCASESPIKDQQPAKRRSPRRCNGDREENCMGKVSESVFQCLDSN